MKERKNYQGSHLNFKSRSPGLILFQKQESHLKNRSPILKKKKEPQRFYHEKLLKKSLTNLIVTSNSSKNFVLKLSCDIVPEVAEGPDAEVEKSSQHEMGEGQCNIYTVYSTKPPLHPPPTPHPPPPAAALTGNPAHRHQTQKSKSSLLDLLTDSLCQNEFNLHLNTHTAPIKPVFNCIILSHFYVNKSSHVAC